MEWMDGCKLTDLEGLRDLHLHSRDVAIELLQAFAQMTFVDGLGTLSDWQGLMQACPFLHVYKSCKARCAWFDLGSYAGRHMHLLAELSLPTCMDSCADLRLCLQFMAILTLGTSWSGHTRGPRVSILLVLTLHRRPSDMSAAAATHTLSWNSSGSLPCEQYVECLRQRHLPWRLLNSWCVESMEPQEGSACSSCGLTSCYSN